MTVLWLILVALLAAGATFLVFGTPLWRKPSPDAVVSEEAVVGDDGDEATARELVVLWGSVLLGMFTTAVYKEVKRGGDIRIERFPVHLLVAAILSPIIVRALLGDKSALRHRRLFQIGLVGYQNGFFWETLLGEFSPFAAEA